jgi:hypothetical protein
MDRDAIALLMSHSGLILDLVIAPSMLFRKTRWIAASFVTFFHFSNKIVFGIGIFPWMMLGTTTIFFDFDWPFKLFKIPQAQLAALPNPRALPLHIRCTLTDFLQLDCTSCLRSRFLVCSRFSKSSRRCCITATRIKCCGASRDFDSRGE